MTICELIEALETTPHDHKIPIGIADPTSLPNTPTGRQAISFRPKRRTSVRSVLALLHSLLVVPLEGEADPVYSDCEISIQSSPWESVSIGPVMVQYWVLGAKGK